jgi:hypothetical protein
MARIDKYDPVSGGFRAPLNASFTGAAAPLGVGLNSSGRLVAGAGQTGIMGVVCSPRNHAAGEVIDVMTDGELVEFGGVAGTTYYAHASTGVISSTPSVYRVGATVEADRLVVRVRPNVGSGAANVVGDQTAIPDLALTEIDAAAGEPTAAALDDANTNQGLIQTKINEIIAALESAGLLST